MCDSRFTALEDIVSCLNCCVIREWQKLLLIFSSCDKNELLLTKYFYLLNIFIYVENFMLQSFKNDSIYDKRNKSFFLEKS